MQANDLLDQILHAAKTQSGLTSSALFDKAGLYASGISRIRATGDCRLSTLIKLLEAANLTLTVTRSDEDVVKLTKGELF